MGAAARKTVCQTFDSHQTTTALKDLFITALQANGVAA
jgi:hypothetical protein